MAIWGVADPLPQPAVYGTVAAGDVSLALGVETTFITTGALSGLNPGPYFPQIWLTATIVLGATAPTALVIAFKLGAGSDVDTYTVEPGLLVNSAELAISVVLIGTNSLTAWQGAGSTINITGLASTHAATAKFVGSRAVVGLFRGPDL